MNCFFYRLGRTHKRIDKMTTNSTSTMPLQEMVMWQQRTWLEVWDEAHEENTRRERERILYYTPHNVDWEGDVLMESADEEDEA